MQSRIGDPACAPHVKCLGTEETMRKRAGNLGFVAVTILLVLLTALCFAGTAASRTTVDSAELEGYYRQQEDRLVSRARSFLEEQGYAYSGVMLTRVVEPDGSREYTLTVHHGEIDRMSEPERDALAERLAGLTFQDETCAVTFFISH